MKVQNVAELQEVLHKRIKEEGITLIALIITIIILVILAAVSINAAYNSGIVNYAVNGTENYINAAEKEKNSIKNAQSMLESAILSSNPFVSEKGVNTPNIKEGMIPIKWNGTNWVVCARDDAEWYDYASATEIAADSSRTMSWANMMLSDGTYKADTVKVGQVVSDSDLGSMFVWLPRYAYSMTHYKTSFEGAGKYDAGKADNLTDNGTTQNITRVVFLKGTTNEGADGSRCARDYDADEVEARVKAEEERATAASEEPTPISTEMIVHPAFFFGGKELTGIWVAKFEASKKTIGTENIVQVLPHVTSWRNITIGNAFVACYNMKNNSTYGLSANANTHLMKNVEWGCVAYLAASQYGKIPTLSDTGTNYYTAGSNESGGYVTNVSQSTTGTVHGVYDLNGGAYERVAAYYDNGNKSLFDYGNISTTNPNMFILNEATGKYELKSEYTAYWDKYEVNGDDGLAGWNANTTAGNLQIAQAAYERAKLMKSKKGDAMYEVIDINNISYYGHKNGNGGNGWFKATYNSSGEATAANDTANSYATGLYGGDYALVGTAVRPFVYRGGYYSSGSYAGVFYVVGSNGSVGILSSFRPVVW